MGVPQSLIRDHGAVSETVARAMAEGALERSPADIAVSVTGIAGPQGGSSEKPVGLVHLACARRGFPTSIAGCSTGPNGPAATFGPAPWRSALQMLLRASPCRRG